MATCEAVQHSDEMACGRCGLRWDLSDPNPPACGLAKPSHICGKAGLQGALAALNRTTESRAGLVHQANGAPLSNPARLKTTAPAEEWMRQAVGRGEVVLEAAAAAPLRMLKFRVGWRVPAELPEAALERMVEAARSANGGHVGEMRAAYRELLAYLGQA